MAPVYNLHPEFGLLCPSPKFRRWAKVTLACLAGSIIIGALALQITHERSADGVLLITYVRHAREQTPDSDDAILRAVSQRLRPVLMTALLASLGLLPAAMSHAIGSDTQRPFAIVIIGGLITSTLLTMMLLPTFYDLADRWFGTGRAKRLLAARGRRGT